MAFNEFEDRGRKVVATDQSGDSLEAEANVIIGVSALEFKISVGTQPPGSIVRAPQQPATNIGALVTQKLADVAPDQRVDQAANEALIERKMLGFNEEYAERQERACVFCKQIAALEAENTRLRGALETAADALQEIATKRKTAVMNASLKNDPKITLLILDLKTYAIDAMRACWTALGVWPPASDPKADALLEGLLKQYATPGNSRKIKP